MMPLLRAALLLTSSPSYATARCSGAPAAWLRAPTTICQISLGQVGFRALQSGALLSAIITRMKLLQP